MADDQNQDAPEDSGLPSDSEGDQPTEGSGLPAPDTGPDDVPPPVDEPASEDDQQERLIAGKYRPDQLDEIEQRLTEADRMHRELAETNRRLQQLEAERTQAQPQSAEERLETLRQQWEEGQITDEQYQDARIEIKASQVVDQRDQRSRLVSIRDKADAALTGAYPDFSVPGTEINRAVQDIVTNYHTEWGIDLRQVPSGSAIVKDALDARFGPRDAARKGALQEATRTERVNRAINGTDRSRPSNQDGSPKEIRLKRDLTEGELKYLRHYGADLNDQEGLRAFFSTATRDVKERMLEDPSVV
jgi:hypothetical protein